MERGRAATVRGGRGRPFGAARLMFGSDWPVCLLVAGYREVLEALRAALPPMPGTDLDGILETPRRGSTT